MVEVGQHPRHQAPHLLAKSRAVEGYVGNFKVTIRKKARYVDIDKCTGCGDCWNVCPSKKNPSEFDYGMGKRKAIYMPFPQAVPARPVIDGRPAPSFIRNGCGLCEKKCQAGAINFEDQDELVEEEVGAIIVATGYQLYDIGKEQDEREARGLRRVRLRPVQGRDRLAAVRAAGLGLGPDRRRDQAALATARRRRPSCSSAASARATTPRACPTARRSAACTPPSTPCSTSTRCTTGRRTCSTWTSARAARTTRSSCAGRSSRTARKYHRGRVSKITEENGKLIVRGADTLAGVPVTIEADMVVLAAAMRPADGVERTGAEAQRRLRRVRLPAPNRTPSCGPVETNAAGVFVCGACQAPKDIPEAVAQASAAAGKVLVMFGHGRADARAGDRPHQRADLRRVLRLRARPARTRDREGRDPRPQGQSDQAHRPRQPRPVHGLRHVRGRLPVEERRPGRLHRAADLRDGGEPEYERNRATGSSRRSSPTSATGARTWARTWRAPTGWSTRPTCGSSGCRAPGGSTST